MISLNRIDDKLIHGKVATSWIKVCDANRIYVVDDETAHNPFLSKIMVSVAPGGIKVVVWDLATAIEKMPLVLAHEKIKAFVIAKGPKEFLEMAKAGVNFKKIIVGNMGSSEGKIQSHPSFLNYTNKEERDMFRELEKMGNRCILQLTPEVVAIPMLETDGFKKAND